MLLRHDGPCFNYASDMKQTGETIR